MDTYELNVLPGEYYTYFTMEPFKKVFSKAELFFIMEADLLVDMAMEISSTYIREEFAKNGDPEFLLPGACYDYIVENNLYKEIIK